MISNQVFSSVVSVVTVYLFAIQLCFLCMDVDTVLNVILKCFTSDLITDARPLTNEEEESIPVGQRYLFTYYFFLLLSVLYNRNVVSYDDETLVTEVLLTLSLTLKRLTPDRITKDYYLSGHQQMAFSALRKIAEEKYDTIDNVLTYCIKNEYLKGMCMFNGIFSLFDINKCFDVGVFNVFHFLEVEGAYENGVL